MKRLFGSLALGSGFVLVSAISGCTPDNTVKPGPPELLAFSVRGPDGNPVAITTADDGGASDPIAPLSAFVAVFDRLLDPTTLETIDPDGGAISEKDGIGVVESGDTPVPSTTLYVPNGDAFFTLIYPKGPSVIITPTRGLPSSSPVTVTLETGKLRSHDQKSSVVLGDGGMSTLTFETQPLSVTVSVPAPVPPDGGADADDGGAGDGGGMSNWVTPPVAPDFDVSISFNNFTDKDATEAAIKVTVNTVPVAATVEPDPSTPGAWTAKHPDGGWPAGAVVTVTVGADAADQFHKTLGTATSATFTVKP